MPRLTPAGAPAATRTASRFAREVQLVRFAAAERAMEREWLADFRAVRYVWSRPMLKRPKQAMVIENQNVLEVPANALRVRSPGQVTRTPLEESGRYPPSL